MRIRLIVVMMAVLGGPSLGWAQVGDGKSSDDHPGWKTCPRCQSNQDRRNAEKEYQVNTRPFDPRDLSGVWGFLGVTLAFAHDTAPPLTEWGKQQYEATRGKTGPDGKVLFNSKDGMLKCDPLGYPRAYTYNYGFELIMLRDRVLQFFEWGHTWRTIWTDGRKLPEEPPISRWLGWNVGRWEGDTFVIEANGFDERSWVAEDFPGRTHGWPHSDQMRIVERYRRVSYGSLETTVTVIDPKTYTRPWTTSATIRLSPGAELWEYFCVPSESQEYHLRVLEPTGKP